MQSNNHVMTRQEAADFLEIPVDATWDVAKTSYKNREAQILASYPPPRNIGETNEMEAEMEPLRIALKTLFPNLANSAIKNQPSSNLGQTTIEMSGRSNGKEAVHQEAFRKSKRSRFDFKKAVVTMVNIAAIIFGFLSFMISAYLECKVINIVFTDPSGNLDLNLPLLGINSTILLVISLEAMKVVTIIMTRWWEAESVQNSKSITWLTNVFKVMLIVLSTCCTIALVNYFLVSAPPKAAMAQYSEEAENDYKVEVARINEFYAPGLKEKLECLAREGAIHGPKYDRCQREHAELVSKKKAELEKAKEQRDVASSSTVVERKVAQYQSPGNSMANSFNSAIKTFGVDLSYEVTVLLFAILLAVLLEISIYIAFNTATFELFRQKNSPAPADSQEPDSVT